eukprot:8325043-Alexandrium_andersonii.AAC.1
MAAWERGEAPARPTPPRGRVSVKTAAPSNASGGDRLPAEASCGPSRSGARASSCARCPVGGRAAATKPASAERDRACCSHP